MLFLELPRNFTYKSYTFVLENKKTKICKKKT